eukprot:2128205-Pleurochrysis_carterae.AAC.2
MKACVCTHTRPQPHARECVYLPGVHSQVGCLEKQVASENRGEEVGEGRLWREGEGAKVRGAKESERVGKEGVGRSSKGQKEEQDGARYSE